MILFYTKDLSGSDALLEEDEFHHCCKVLRQKIGDTIEVTNGKGTFATANIQSISKRSATLQITSTRKKEPTKTKVILAIAPPKNRTRWEWLIEKTVEIGVTDIIPMITKRTERHKLNEDRTHKILRSAALQSMRSYHPTLHPVLEFSQVLNSEFSTGSKFIASFSEDNPFLTSLNPTHQQSIILIGPEGDFTEDEILAAKEHSYSCVNISRNRLRTETAAVVAIGQLVMKNGFENLS